MDTHISRIILGWGRNLLKYVMKWNSKPSNIYLHSRLFYVTIGYLISLLELKTVSQCGMVAISNGRIAPDRVG